MPQVDLWGNPKFPFWASPGNIASASCHIRSRALAVSSEPTMMSLFPSFPFSNLHGSASLLPQSRLFKAGLSFHQSLPSTARD